MELINATRMQAGYTLGMDTAGRERVVVVVKGTFRLPLDGSEPALLDEQVPPVMADVFTGEPGYSATLYESEFAPFKPRCDVLLNGSAYAPHGRAAERVKVGLRVGSVSKVFEVVGNRVWESGGVVALAGRPQPFITMPITYDRAYGGNDVAPDNPEKVRAFPLNPVGTGYYPLADVGARIGRPLANTQEVDRPAENPSGRYEPMSFGALGRNFGPRIAYAGTYDEAWLENVFPFLPADFDPQYYQAAPPDQQLEQLLGGEVVELFNLTPEPYTRIQFPQVDVPVEFTDAQYTRTEVRAVLDTLLLEPDLGRFMMVWRASHPLKRNLLEMRQAVVGRMTRGWYRARDLGKNYYPSLQQMVASRIEEAV
jgi:hypothetical protein